MTVSTRRVAPPCPEERWLWTACMTKWSLLDRSSGCVMNPGTPIDRHLIKAASWALPRSRTITKIRSTPISWEPRVGNPRCILDPRRISWKWTPGGRGRGSGIRTRSCWAMTNCWMRLIRAINFRGHSIDRSDNLSRECPRIHRLSDREKWGTWVAGICKRVIATSETTRGPISRKGESWWAIPPGEATRVTQWVEAYLSAPPRMERAKNRGLALWSPERNPALRRVPGLLLVSRFSNSWIKRRDRVERNVAPAGFRGWRHIATRTRARTQSKTRPCIPWVRWKVDSRIRITRQFIDLRTINSTRWIDLTLRVRSWARTCMGSGPRATTRSFR